MGLTHLLVSGVQIQKAPASAAGFGYSGALSEFAAVNQWTYDHLDGFLEKPKKYISGTTMAFAGIGKPEERANLIAYLRTLADEPAPLPEVDEAEPADEEAAAPTEDEPAAPADEEPAAPAEEETEPSTPSEDEPTAPAQTETEPSASEEPAPAAD